MWLAIVYADSQHNIKIMDMDLDDDIGCDSDDEVLQFSGDEVDDAAGTREFGISSSQTLTPDMISKKMFEIISEVNEVFHVSQLCSLYLICIV